MAKFSLPSLPLEKIEALSRLHRILICVGLFLILGGGFFYLIYMPKSGKVTELKKNYDEIENKLVKARASAKNLKRFKKQLEEAQVKFRLALQLLPDKKEIPNLLEGISNSGKDSGLEFISFRPGQEVSKDFYAEIPVNITVNGGYHNLAMFFDRVARLSRIVNILNISIRDPKGAEGVLNATCVATTYRFLEASGAEPADKESKKGKKG